MRLRMAGLEKMAVAGFLLLTAAGMGPSLEARGQGQASQGQSQSTGQSQSPAQPAANAPQDQEIPDTPSAVQPPPAKFPDTPVGPAAPAPGENDNAQPAADTTTPAPKPKIETIPPGTGERNVINPDEPLYKIVTKVNFVQIPVMVKDSDGRRVDGLLPKDFIVLEDGQRQTLTFFTSDPFQLSVAVLLDTGMSDIAVQKMNETYTALVGAFSRYDEVAIYTYSSTVSQVTDYTGRSERLTAELNQIKMVRGGSSGPPVMGGPFSANGPTVNGAPLGSPGGIAPVNTPEREAHVLNDAILRAAQDLEKRDKARRKVIFVISDGRERGSQASFRQVLKGLQTHNIEVKAVVMDTNALPGVRQIEKVHLPLQGYSDILPKYVSATGGGQVFSELTRNSIEEAYASITSEARNQYTLGYVPTIIASAKQAAKAYRTIEVRVDKRGLKIYAKDGYYPNLGGQ
jgi:VWFA-related protein